MKTDKTRSKFIFDIDIEDKKKFKALCANSGLSMGDVLNDLIKTVILEATYIKKN